MRVAIVGSAPYGRKFGEEIDAADIIIRFNNYKINGHEEYIGSRTTVWCLSSNIWKDVKTQKNNCNEMWIVQRPRINDEMKLLAKHKCATIYPVPQEYDHAVSRELGGKFPSTGIVAVYTAWKRYGVPLYVYGFNSFDNTEKLHYYDSVDVTKITCPHNGDAERLYLNSLRAAGIVLPKLPLIL